MTHDTDDYAVISVSEAVVETILASAGKTEEQLREDAEIAYARVLAAGTKIYYAMKRESNGEADS